MSKKLTLEEAFTPSPPSSLEETNANTLLQREKIPQPKEIINHASNQAIKQSSNQLEWREKK